MSRQDLSTLVADVLRDGRGYERALRDEFLDERIPTLIKARYAAEDIFFTEQAKDAAVRRLLESLREAPATPRELRDGYMRLLRPPRRAPAWVFAGAVAVLIAFLFLYLALFQTGADPKQAPLVQSDIEQPAPESPDLPLPPSPEAPPDRQRPQPPHRRDGPGAMIAERVQVGEFAYVMGEPMVTLPGEASEVPAVPGMAVYAGSRIETDDIDRAEIRLADGSTVALDFNTTVEIPAADAGQISSIHVPIGRIFAKVEPLEEGETFAVTTPIATAEVLGTEFNLTVERLSGARLQVILQVRRGTVEFRNRLGSVRASDMTESTAITGSAPSEPKRIPVLRTFALRSDGHSHLATTQRLHIPTAARRFVYPVGEAGLGVGRNPGGELQVHRVAAGSSAAEAGLRVGDIIVAIDDVPVRSVLEVQRAIFLSSAESLTIRTLRDGQQRISFLTPRPTSARPPDVPHELAEILYGATRTALHGNIETAITELQALAAALPHAAIYNNIGVAYEVLDELAPAIRNYTTAAKTQPNVALYRYNLGLALRKIGNFARAAEELAHAASADPEFLEAAEELAETLAIMGRFQDAADILQAALVTEPEKPELWRRMADVLLLSHKTEDALEAIQQALRIEPDYSDGLALLAEIYHDLGRPDEAEQVWLRCIEIHPGHAVGYNNYGMLLFRLRRFDEAEHYFRVAIQLDGSMAAFHNNLGGLLSVTGRAEEAERSLLTAISLDPGFAGAYGVLGQLLDNVGRQDEAETYYRRATELDPDAAVSHHNLGVLLGKLGRLEEAVQSLLAAIRILELQNQAIPRAHSWFRLGEVYERGGDIAKARAAYQQSLSLNPDHPGSKEALSRLSGGLAAVVCPRYLQQIC